jgi:hypothetical protein
MSSRRKTPAAEPEADTPATEPEPEAGARAYASGGSEPVAGVARDPMELSAAELMALPPLNPARDPLFTERFPIPEVEMRELQAEAALPQANALAAMETLVIVEDSSAGAEADELEALTEDPP